MQEFIFIYMGSRQIPFKITKHYSRQLANNDHVLLINLPPFWIMKYKPCQKVYFIPPRSPSQTYDAKKPEQFFLT